MSGPQVGDPLVSGPQVGATQDLGQRACLESHSIFTSAEDGDFAVPSVQRLESLTREEALDVSAALELRRSAIAPRPWTWLRQVHGNRVVVVESPGQFAGEEADAAVTASAEAVLCVQTADCASVLFQGVCDHQLPSGASETCVVAVGAAHAGWRGIAAEILQKTVDEMFLLGSERVIWQLGPCISPAFYEFGTADLQALVDRYDESLRGRTTHGQAALDLRAAVKAALKETKAEQAEGQQGDAQQIPCTASQQGYYSWRARQDTERQTAATWMTVKNQSFLQELTQ
ncbi:MAG: polyphenol oxidase family protein [Microthrixaceae bacterium]